MSTPEDDWPDLIAAAPTPSDQCTLAPAEFDLGRLQAWQSGTQDDDVVQHLSTCAFCRSLLPGLAIPQTDAMTRALADRLPRPRRWAAPAVAVLACAAAMLFFALRPDTRLPMTALSPTPSGLNYREARFSGGLATTKSTTGSTRFTADSTLRWVLSPPSSTARARSAQVYRVNSNGRLVAQPAKVQVLPTGAVRIVIEGARLPPGAVTLIAVVTLGDAPALAGTLATTLPGMPGASIFFRQIQVGPASE